MRPPHLTDFEGEDMDLSTSLYRRCIDVESTQVGADCIRVTGRLRDTVPEEGGVFVHDMGLSLLVRLSDLVVVEVEADMSAFPHTECPLITPSFDALVGVSIRKGFSKELNQRLGGPSGCSHLKEIARAIAPVVLQSMMTRRLPAQRSDLSVPARPPAGSCHIWREDGVAVRKLEAGWVPGTTTRPVPPLSTFTDRHHRRDRAGQ
jgi:hypothetical protein